MQDNIRTAGMLNIVCRTHRGLRRRLTTPKYIKLRAREHYPHKPEARLRGEVIRQRSRNERASRWVAADGRSVVLRLHDTQDDTGHVVTGGAVVRVL